MFACSVDATRRPPERKFGYLTASLDAESFTGTFGPDSTVAVFNPDFGQLQIEGNRRGRSWWEVVRVTMVCQRTPNQGAYRISTPFFTPVSAEVHRTNIRRWLPRQWRTTNHSFISDSITPGILRLDTLDLKSGAISGSFLVRVRTIDQKPVDSLFVTGVFTGRVRPSSFRSTRPVRFSPEMGRDCESAKSSD
jgi:hypothetical protein